MLTNNAERISLEEKIVNIIIDEIGKGNLSDDQASEISTFAQKELDEANNSQELLEIIEKMCLKWPFFERLKTTLQLQTNEDVDKEVHDGAVALTEHGKIDEAIKLMKTAKD